VTPRACRDTTKQVKDNNEATVVGAWSGAMDAPNVGVFRKPLHRQFASLNGTIQYSTLTNFHCNIE